MPVMIHRLELRKNVISKLQKTDFIALRHVSGETDNWAGFIWEEWAEYRAALRDIIKIIKEETALEMNADIMPWPTRPLIPAFKPNKSDEETQEHRERMLSEYGKELPNPF
jgi:hypothetical protein